MNRQEATYFYLKHYKRLYNISFRIVGNGGEAEEIMQDTILKYIDNPLTDAGEAQILSYLAKICISASIDCIRKRHELDDKDYLLTTSDTDIPNREEFNNERMLKVRDGIMEMKNPYRTILSLYFLEGFDYEEIAQITLQKQSTVRSQISRGIVKLKKLMNDGKIF